MYCQGKKKIATNLDAAFVDIAKGVTCYLETAHIKDAWFSKQCRSGKLTEGDELVVQITKRRSRPSIPLQIPSFHLPENILS